MSRWYLKSLPMAASRARSRRAAWSFCTRLAVRWVEDPEPVLDEPQPETRRQVALSRARRAEQKHIGPFLEPDVAARQHAHTRLRDRGNEREVEVVERLAARLRLGPVPLEAPPLPVGNLLGGQRGEQARRGPALPVRAFRDAPPQGSHGGQAQLLEQQVDLWRVHDEGVVHAGAPFRQVSSQADMGGRHTPTSGMPSGFATKRLPRTAGSGSSPAARHLSISAASRASQQ